MYLSQQVNVNVTRRKRMKEIQEDMEIIRQVKKARNEANIKKSVPPRSSNYTADGEWCGGKENTFRSTQSGENPFPVPGRNLSQPSSVFNGSGNFHSSSNNIDHTQQHGTTSSIPSFLNPVTRSTDIKSKGIRGGWQMLRSTPAFRTPATSKSCVSQPSPPKRRALNDAFYNNVTLPERSEPQLRTPYQTPRNFYDENCRTPYEVNVSTVRVTTSTFVQGRVLQSPWVTKDNKNSFETEKFSLTEIIEKICGEQFSQNVAANVHSQKPKIRNPVSSSRILSPSYVSDWSTRHQPIASPYFLSSNPNRNVVATPKPGFNKDNLTAKPDGVSHFTILNSTPISIPVSDSEEEKSPYFNSSEKEADIFSGGLCLIRQTYNDVGDPFSPGISRWDKYEDDF